VQSLHLQTDHVTPLPALEPTRMTNERTVLDPRSASTYLGIAVQTLARWRVEGAGPPFLKLGTAIRYDRSDLDTWLDARRQRSTTESTVGAVTRGRQ
jgi:predicted DNA-binding transcriptional regulator AlpA